MKSPRKSLVSQRLTWYEKIDSTFLTLSGRSRLEIKLRKESLNKEKDDLLGVYYNGSPTEEIENRVIDIGIEIEHIENELESLLEMEVIYIYKSYEYNVKKILIYAFPDVSVKQISYWDKMADFLSQKGVNVSTCIGVGQLRKFKNLNNEIKHEAFAQSKSLEALGCTRVSEFETYVSNSKLEIESFLHELNSKIRAVLDSDDSAYMNEILEGIEVLRYCAASGKRYT